MPKKSKTSEANKKIDKAASAIASRVVPVDRVGFWTDEFKAKARDAHKKGRSTVTLDGRKFKLCVSKANKSYFVVTPADGSPVPMACLDRRTYN